MRTFSIRDSRIENSSDNLYVKQPMRPIHLEGGAVVDAVIHIPGYRTVKMALAGMLRGLEIPVAVIPGQQHVLTKPLFRLGIRETHGLSVIRQPFRRRKFHDRQLRQVRPGGERTENRVLLFVGHRSLLSGFKLFNTVVHKR